MSKGTQDTYIPPHPRTHAAQKADAKAHRDRWGSQRVVLRRAELERARSLATKVKALGIRVPQERSWCAPDAAWLLGAAVELGLPLLEKHLADTGCLPKRE